MIGLYVLFYYPTLMTWAFAYGVVGIGNWSACGLADNLTACLVSNNKLHCFFYIKIKLVNAILATGDPILTGFALLCARGGHLTPSTGQIVKLISALLLPPTSHSPTSPSVPRGIQRKLHQLRCHHQGGEMFPVH